MRSLLVIFMAIVFPFVLTAQEEPVHPRNNMNIQGKTFNMGATVGFNSIFPIINSIQVDGIELENIHLTYKVGHQASLFFRINVDRFFIQPSFSWQYSEGDIHFDMLPKEVQSDPLANSATILQTNRLEMTKKALQVPVHIGYHIVRQGPYGLSFTAGPTFKYNYNVSYQSLSPEAGHVFISESNPFGMNIGMGISVQIWSFFFDFSYEFGLNQTESDFRSKQEEIPVLSNNIHIDKRTNVLSFSLGIVF